MYIIYSISTILVLCPKPKIWFLANPGLAVDAITLMPNDAILVPRFVTDGPDPVRSANPGQTRSFSIFLRCWE